jgi:hypothetical protein
MLERRAYQSLQESELLDFAHQHPWQPAWPQAQLEAFLKHMISGPAQVIDLWQAEQRVLSAVLLDKVQNLGQHACLEFLGFNSDALRFQADSAPLALYQQILDEARSLLTAQQQGIQLGAAPSLGLNSDLLKSLGCRHYYDMYEMSCKTPGSLSAHRPEPRAELLQAHQYRDYYELLKEAFEHNPDICIQILRPAGKLTNKPRET